MAAKSEEDPRELIRDLQVRLDEAEETLRALRNGEIDAVVASGPEGDRVYTLKGADEAYRAMVQNMAEGALTLTLEGLILFSNEQFASMLGIPLERVIGASIYDFIEVEHRPLLSALLAGSDGVKAEVWLSKGAGVVAPAQLSAKRLSFGGSECVCLIVMDLADRKLHEEMIAAERSLREREAYLRSLGDNLPDGCIFKFSVGIDGRPCVEFISAGIERLTGVPASEYLRDPSTLERNILPEDVGRLSAAIEESRRTLRRFEIEVRHRHRATGEVRVSLMRSMPSRRSDGSTVWDGIELDITERKRAEQDLRIRDDQLRQAQKMESIGLLAGGIAHDFNNLLTGVIGNASLALESLPVWHRDRPLIEAVIGSATRAADLTRQLLAYAGKGRFVVRQVNVSEAAREMAVLLRGSIPATIGIDLDLDENIALVEADAGQIQQLIMNLALNASEAIGDQPGRIRIQTQVRSVDAALIEQNRLDIPPGSYVCLEVGDTGSGIDEAALPRIFEPFFTTKFTGRGLGLAAVHGIVRAHKGAVMVYSHAGHGACFTVMLPPAVPDAAAKAESAPAAENRAGQGTILVVDDEESVRSVAKASLERYGYRVLVARNGIEALETLEQDPSRLAAVLLDLTMPLIGGEETLRRLLAVRADLPVLISSGYNEIEVMKRFAGQPFAGFVGKPYTASTLLAKVNAVCGVSGPAPVPPPKPPRVTEL
jgi:PAS domain S-box-containing protein